MGMTGEQAYALAKKLIESSGGGGGTVDAYTKAQTDNLLFQKVDKEDGKGLFSGSYNDLTDAPTIPTKTSELTNDSRYMTEQAVSDEVNELNSNLDGLEFGEVAGGKNLWDEEWQVGIITADDGRYIDYNGDISSINFSKVKPNTTYYVASNATVYIKYFDSSKNPIGATWGASGKNSTFKTTSDTAYIKFRTNENGGTYNDDIAIIEGTSGAYKPYIPSVKMLAEEVSAQKADLSDEWTSKTYSVGDYCIYKNSMWRCLVANSVEPSEGSNWTRVTIGSELKRIITMIN